MSRKEVDLFVPGRLCLFGEHTDWAGMYRSVNSALERVRQLLRELSRESMRRRSAARSLS